MELIGIIDGILAYGPICDHCLGRLFGKKSHGLTNDERGRGLRITHALIKDIPFIKRGEPCWICGDLFEDTMTWAERVKEAVAGIDYRTFLIGCRVPPLMVESEEMVWSDLSLDAPEPLKAEFNREVGKAVSLITGSEVDFKRPDIVAICDIATDSVEVQVNPLFIYGRYLKYERGIPQTRWHCRECRGAGCERCNFTGKMYQDSVEELIGRPVIETLMAADAILHGAGREDIDARMIGTGRPFILEVVEPKRRSVELPALEDIINTSADGRVAVRLDHISDHREVETLKSEKAHKKYSILVEIEGDFSPQDCRIAAEALKGVVIHQRTPLRVSHRRSDRVRKRRVIDIECMGMEDGEFLIDIVGEAGLYIKELISGDGGRTKPSFAEIIGSPARVTRLDVVMVEAVVPEEGLPDYK